MEYAHAQQYVDDIADICDSLDTTTYHFDAKYEEHLQYGDKVNTIRKQLGTSFTMLMIIKTYILYSLEK